MSRKSQTETQAGAVPPLVPPPAKILAHALLEAQRAVDSVAKDGKNSHHGYAYTTAEGMIGACRLALHGAGLTFSRIGWELAADGQSVDSEFLLQHPESGAVQSFRVSWLVVVERGRPIDKALAGALTTCMGYFLRDLLLLPREEGDVMDKRNDSPSGSGSRQGWRHERDERKAAPDVSERLSAAKKAEPPARANAAPPAARHAADLPRAVEATVKKLTPRAVGDQTFLVATLEVEGALLDCIASEKLNAAPAELVGKTVTCYLQRRGDKMPLWIEVAERQPRAGNAAEMQRVVEEEAGVEDLY